MTPHRSRRRWARRLSTATAIYLTLAFSALPAPDDLAGRVGLAAGLTFTAPPYHTWAPAHDRTPPVDPVLLALAAVMVLPLLWRHRAPYPVLAVVLAGYATANLLGAPPMPADYGVLVALYYTARHAPAAHRPRWAATLGAAALAWIALLVAHGTVAAPGDQLGPGQLAPGEVLLPFAAFFAAWWVGLGSARRRDNTHLREAQARDHERAVRAEAQQSAAEDRLRIARDLHDGLGRNLTAIAMLAAATHTTDPRTSDSLTRIEQAARASLTETRRVLATLREPEQAGNTLADLPEVAARATAAGTPTDLHLTLDGVTVPHPVQATAYRIVQEALTNALRHAPTAAVRILITADHSTPALNVLIHNDASPDDIPAPPTGGHGIMGMRERAQRLGGHLDAGPEPGGTGWRVQATLPLTDTRDKDAT